MIIIDNDITSYNKEQAAGNCNHNIIKIIMHQMKLDLEGAMKWAAVYHSGSRRKFLEGLKKVPSWGEEIDPQVQQYLNGIACWPRGNYCWSFESGRYFGNKGLDYQKTLQIPLLAKVMPAGNDVDLSPENLLVYRVEETD